MLFDVKPALRLSIPVFFILYLTSAFWNILNPGSQVAKVFIEFGVYPQFPLFTFLPGTSKTAVQSSCLHLSHQNQPSDPIEQDAFGCESSTSWRDYQVSYMLTYPVVRAIQDIPTSKSRIAGVLNALLVSRCGQRSDGRSEAKYEVRFQSFEEPMGQFQILASASLSCADRQIELKDFQISKLINPS